MKRRFSDLSSRKLLGPYLFFHNAARPQTQNGRRFSDLSFRKLLGLHLIYLSKKTSRCRKAASTFTEGQRGRGAEGRRSLDLSFRKHLELHLISLLKKTSRFRKAENKMEGEKIRGVGEGGAAFPRKQ